MAKVWNTFPYVSFPCPNRIIEHGFNLKHARNCQYIILRYPVQHRTTYAHPAAVWAANMLSVRYSTYLLVRCIRFFHRDKYSYIYMQVSLPAMHAWSIDCRKCNWQRGRSRTDISRVVQYSDRTDVSPTRLLRYLQGKGKSTESGWPGCESGLVAIGLGNRERRLAESLAAQNLDPLKFNTRFRSFCLEYTQRYDQPLYIITHPPPHPSL